MRHALAAASAVLITAVAAPAAVAEPLLPDLSQETPHELEVATDGKRFHLGFRSVIYNYGDGVLRVLGQRDSRDNPTMTVAQLIDQTDGTQQRVEAIGEMRYVDSITHRHWHYMRASTYSLKRTDGKLARPDQKTGFCLGDRFRAPLLRPDSNPDPPTAYSGIGCGYDSPNELKMEMGIASGHADDYGPQVEGQFIDITGLRAGRYQLVHEVNPTGSIQEKSLANNSSSVLIEVRWKRGQPVVTRLAECRGSGTCPVPPVMTKARATALARGALHAAFRVRGGGISCEVVNERRGNCTWARGTVDVRYTALRGHVYWSWKATSRGKKRSDRGELSLGRPRRVPVERFSGKAAAAKSAWFCELA